MAKTNLTDEQIQEAIRRYNEGESTHQIAKDFGLVGMQIFRVLKKHGVVFRDNKESNDKRVEFGREYYWLGKTMPEEMRLKCSQAQIKRWEEASDEYWEAARERGREMWAKRTPAEREKMIELSKVALEKVKHEGSRIEKLVRLQLIDLGIPYERHKKDLIPNSKLEIDIYLPEHRAVIEVDGPSHFLPIFGQAALEDQIKRDMKKNGLLMGYGYVVMRLKMLSGSFTLVDQHNIKEWLKETIPKTLTNRKDRLLELEIQ